MIPLDAKIELVYVGNPVKRFLERVFKDVNPQRVTFEVADEWGGYIKENASYFVEELQKKINPWSSNQIISKYLNDWIEKTFFRGGIGVAINYKNNQYGFSGIASFKLPLEDKRNVDETFTKLKNGLFTDLPISFKSISYEDYLLCGILVNSDEPKILPHTNKDEALKNFSIFSNGIETLANRIIQLTKPVITIEDIQDVKSYQFHVFMHGYNYRRGLPDVEAELDLVKKENVSFLQETSVPVNELGRVLAHPKSLGDTFSNLNEEGNEEAGSRASRVSEKILVMKSDELKKSLADGLITDWGDLVGCDDAKEELITYADYINDPVAYACGGVLSPTGAILEGPAGTGKTTLAKILAMKTDSFFVNLKASDFKRSLYGITEQRFDSWVKELQITGRAILYFDEFDEIAITSEGGRSCDRADRSIISSMKRFLDGLDTREGLFFLASTNYIELIDPYLRSRLRVIHFSLPNACERSLILKKEIERSYLYRDKKLTMLLEAKQIESMPTLVDIYSKDINFEEFGKRSIDLSGRDIKNLNEKAKRNRIKKFRETGVLHPITSAHLIELIRKFRPIETHKVIGLIK